jgi:hypothetical protein
MPKNTTQKERGTPCFFDLTEALQYSSRLPRTSTTAGQDAERWMSGLSRTPGKRV